MDVTSDEGVVAAVAAVAACISEFGRMDVLMNSMSPPAPATLPAPAVAIS